MKILFNLIKLSHVAVVSFTAKVKVYLLRYRYVHNSDIWRIHAKWLNFRYVDGIPTMVKVQIPYLVVVKSRKYCF